MNDLPQDNPSMREHPANEPENVQPIPGSPLCKKNPPADIASETIPPDGEIIEKYRLITENMADTVWVMDMNLRFIYASPSVERMYGATVAEVVERPIQDYMTPESFQKALQTFAEEMALEETGAADPRRTRTIELEEYKKDGTVIWVESILSFVRDAQGKAVGVLGVSRDISKRKEVEAEKERLGRINRQLQRSDSLARMAAAIAHHFNNQLQVVVGGLELAMNQVPENAKVFATLRKIREASRKASDISRTMLTYLGQISGARCAIDLCGVCKNSLSQLLASAPKRVSFETGFPQAGPVVLADEEMIRNMLATLVINAWEASGEEAGAIRIAVDTVEPARIDSRHRFPVDWYPDDTRYGCMIVEDHGCGVIEADIEKMFEPFYTTKLMGRGMGLPALLGILRAYGGCITVWSVPNQGSVFRVYLPVFQGKPSDAISHPVSMMQQYPKNIGVLLIDDEDMVRDIAEMMLKRLGYEVIKARGGKEGIKLFERRRRSIDVVISDLTMPGMNGWQTLAGLRAVDPQVAVILSSGYDEAHVMEAGGAVDPPSAFLGKPYRLQDLSQCLQEVLHRTT